MSRREIRASGRVSRRLRRSRRSVSGALADQPWLQNGQIVLTGSNAAAFSTWYDEYKGSLGQLADKESQYQFLMQQQEQLTEDKAGGGGS
jgi:hypothetical protein